MGTYSELLPKLKPQGAKKENFLHRIYSFVREYTFSWTSLFGATTGAGLASVTAFTIATVYSAPSNVEQLFNSGDLVTALYSVPNSATETYNYAKDFASQWTAPGAAAGQFIAYRAKKIFKSFLESVVK